MSGLYSSKSAFASVMHWAEHHELALLLFIIVTAVWDPLTLHIRVHASERVRL